MLEVWNLGPEPKPRDLMQEQDLEEEPVVVVVVAAAAAAAAAATAAQPTFFKENPLEVWSLASKTDYSGKLPWL